MFAFTIKLTIFTLVVIYAIIPGLLYIFPRLISKVVFLDSIYCPFYNNLTDYQYYGLHENNTITMHVVNEESGIKLGIWYIVPPAMEIQTSDTHDSSLQQTFLRTLSSSRGDIVLYMHGNVFHRGSRSSRRLYLRLRNIGLEIITMDYRGYGDSERNGFSDEESVVSDAVAVYKFIRTHRPHSRIFIWGHSLGTGVASSLTATLKLHSMKGEQLRQIMPPSGIILETPFMSLREAGEAHPHGTLYRRIPFLFNIILDSFARADIFFKNRENLLHSECPILILHAEDDHIVPISQARELYQTLLQHGKMVTLKEFQGHLQYQHVGIPTAPELEDILESFIQTCK